MDIELKLFGILRNIEGWTLKNNQIQSSSWKFSIHLEIVHRVAFEHTSFDISTLLQLLNGLESVQQLFFVSCNPISYDHVENRFITVRNEIAFTWPLN
jgi:hypothetical protein